ncbi:GTP pyrophosphokinase [Pigmentiphaga humi]|uniref:GTP pyrophosphokinase n=1 Tax=Pigmentiphaga humi TaxID=2478468 RepID=A0A3P4B7J7_9BURK|nr:bifunctional (p)ppGpp synthetase/guanosine-3',5'-bis(diphosphate) 3'-pyrophosphohydrolase [Pigmentiphaga humi]VCU72279.1 GTP pyrophosphokinase [Pigmentiphaga humi]
MNEPAFDASGVLSAIFDPDWWQAATAGLSDAAQQDLRQALDWAQTRYARTLSAEGEAPARHAAGVVVILAGLQVDVHTRMAALLAIAVGAQDAARPGEDAVMARFGPEIGRLVQGYRALIRLGQVTRDASDAAAGSGAQAEMLRKMLLAMAADLRIVLMRLASRLRTLRWHAQNKVPLPEALARETLELYAPLANRLGIWQVKWEMEDTAFRFLEPVKYKEIAYLLEEKRVEREAFITNAIARVRDALAAAGIEADVTGRPKHIYSIWNKMRNRNLDFSGLYDLRALRIIVDDIRTCYTVLGLIHHLWSPVPDEFDDYISRPKPNGYRSLHTVVYDDNGRPFEVQIRTHEMHQFAEYGMAAHWRYKEAGAKGGKVSADSEYDRKLSWIRQLLAWKDDVQVDDELGQSALKALADNVYVLTPQARVIELAPGATPVDFAYQVHTDLGHRCRGARVDGVMVPLNTRLRTGQTVEIIAAKSGGPSRDWLNPQLGYLASQRSRAKVRAWFNAIDIQERIAQGQGMLEKELQRLGKTATNLEVLAQQLGFACTDDLCVALAKDEFSVRQVASAFEAPPPAAEEPDLSALTRDSRPESAVHAGKSGVLVVGVDALLTQLAKCCRPAPPDPISGFVTRGRGVSIHRSDCKSFRALALREPERIIDVAWGETSDAVYPVDIVVMASDRHGLLRDISEVFARQRINVIGVNTQSKQGSARMVFTAEVGNGAHLTRALASIREVAGVLEAERR